MTDTLKPTTNEELICYLEAEAEDAAERGRPVAAQKFRTAAERIRQQGTADPEALKLEFREFWTTKPTVAQRAFADSIANDDYEWTAAVDWYAGRTGS